jgi:magnesium chelatase accessory protein
MPAMTTPLDWQRDGGDWPNRAASRFVTAGGVRWHVQQFGAGETLVLVHGTGASTHSWRSLAAPLAAHYALLTLDLPGHGFTSALPNGAQTLPGMGAALSALFGELGVKPAVAVGHSAGAAILARMALDGAIAPRALVSLNGALLPWRGLPAALFSPLARLMAANSLVPRLFAWRAGDGAAVERLIESTGSRLDPRGVELYARLTRNPAHVAGALAMMANWDLGPLERDLPRLKVPLLQIIGGNDRTVPPSEAERVRRLLPSARIVSLPGLGHLAHEEDAARVAEAIRSFAASGASTP